MEIRDALPEDAPEACIVLRRSIAAPHPPVPALPAQGRCVGHLLT